MSGDNKNAVISCYLNWLNYLNNTALSILLMFANIFILITNLVTLIMLIFPKKIMMIPFF